MLEDLKNRIGLRVREARTGAGYTQPQLAEAIDKTYETISKMERGETAPHIATLYDISVVLKVPMRFFFEEIAGADEEDVSRRRLELLQQSQMIASRMTDRQLAQWNEIGEVIERHE